jgi:hypothetical protein
MRDFWSGDNGDGGLSKKSFEAFSMHIEIPLQATQKLAYPAPTDRKAEQGSTITYYHYFFGLLFP